MSDKRKFSRHHIELSVTFTGDQVSDQGRVLDLSVGGCRVKSAAAIFSGEFIGMLIQLPGRDMPLAIGLATVRWASEQEFGVEFIRMEPDQQALLHRFTQKLESSGGRIDRPSSANGRHTPVQTCRYVDQEERTGGTSSFTKP